MADAAPTNGTSASHSPAPPSDTKSNGAADAVESPAVPAKRSRSPRRSSRRSRSPSRSRSRSRRSHRRRSRSHRHRRSRSRSRSGSRRRHRSSRRRHRSRRRSRSPSASRSRSRSRSRHRRRKKASSNFDVAPGMPVAVPGAAGGFGVMPPQMMQFMGMRAQIPQPSNQQTRHARRLYVGGIGDITEAELQQFFNETVSKILTTPLPPGTKPVLSVYVNSERRFAFVEFISIELCTACMALDGLVFRGSALRIRRPNDYRPDMVPQGGVLPQLDLARVTMGVGGGSGGGSGGGFSENRIFIGGIPYSMAEPQVRELFSAFGELKDLQLIMDNGQPKGYGFCEYKDPAITDVAIANLNNQMISGRNLTVRRANPPGVRGQPAGMAPGLMGAPGLMPGMMPGMLPGMAPGMMPGMMPGMAPGMMNGAGVMPGGAGGAAGAGAAGTPTAVLELGGMVTDADLKDDEEYEDIKLDVAEECAKFGKVSKVDIPRIGQPNQGKVFVYYETAAMATAGMMGLRGRKFGDNVVTVSYADPARELAQGAAPAAAPTPAPAPASAPASAPAADQAAEQAS